MTGSTTPPRGLTVIQRSDSHVRIEEMVAFVTKTDTFLVSLGRGISPDCPTAASMLSRTHIDALQGVMAEATMPCQVDAWKALVEDFRSTCTPLKAISSDAVCPRSGYYSTLLTATLPEGYSRDMLPGSTVDDLYDDLKIVAKTFPGLHADFVMWEKSVWSNDNVPLTGFTVIHESVVPWFGSLASRPPPQPVAIEAGLFRHHNLFASTWSKADHAPVGAIQNAVSKFPGTLTSFLSPASRDPRYAAIRSGLRSIT